MGDRNGASSRSASHYCCSRRISRVEEHYLISLDNFELLGPLRHDENKSRDVHDWFNIIMLVPICVLNWMNWAFGDGKLAGVLSGAAAAPSLWAGNYFNAFFWVTVAYFVSDALWVAVLPNCVKSPMTILVHHLSTLMYLLIPYLYPEYGWLMGACLSVEVNTWLLIARRLFNRDGHVVFSFSAQTPGGPVQVKIISVLFYITWVVIRLFIYPAVFFIVVGEYLQRADNVHSHFNALVPAPVLQAVFCVLNFKWSYDLLLSKMRKGKGKGDGKSL